MGGTVADANGSRAVIARQAVELPLEQVPFASESIHDLQLGGIPRDGSDQPGSPAISDPKEPVADEGLKGERRITQPDVAIVPVARSAELFGQRGRRGRHDPPGVVVRQCAQHQ